MGQDFFSGKPRFDPAVAIAPGLEFFYDPCSQASRRVIQSRGEAVRFRGLNESIGAFLFHPLVVPFEESFFGRGEIIGLLKEVTKGDIGEMDGCDDVRVITGELFCHGAAPVAAVCSESVVAKLLGHEAGPHVTDAKDGSVVGWFAGEAIAGQIRDDDIEGVFGAAAEGLRVGEHRNQLGKAIERVGIAVCQQKRKGVRSAASLMDVVNIDIGDLCLEMRELVELSFLLAPVEGVLPEIQQLGEIVGVCARAPVAFCWVNRKAGFRQSALEIGEDLLVQMDGERFDLTGGSQSHHSPKSNRNTLLQMPFFVRGLRVP